MRFVFAAWPIGAVGLGGSGRRVLGSVGFFEGGLVDRRECFAESLEFDSL